MSLFAPDGMLVVTPPPQVGESVFGYILRLAEKNGYATPWHLFAVAGIDQKRMFRVTVPPERLATVLGRPTAEIEQLPWYRFPTGEPMPAFNIGTSRFRRSMDPRMRSKICPRCVQERGFLDASWELKVMVACPHHRTPLVTHCQACGNALSWFRPGMDGCRCGAAIAESSNVTISQPMADLLLGVQNCFFGTHQNGACTEFCVNGPKAGNCRLVRRHNEPNEACSP